MPQPADPPDPVLDQARRAEEKLRNILDARLPVGELARKAPVAAGAAAPSLSVALEPDVIQILEGPEGDLSWGLRAVPAEATMGELLEGAVDLAPSVLDELARVAPAVASVLQQRGLFELIGPAAALKGLRDGALELIPGRSGGLLGGIRIVGKTQIIHQARFRPVRLASAVGPQLAFAALTAVVGQVHLAEIRRELAQLRAQVTRVLEGQQAARHGAVGAAVEVIAEVSTAWRTSGTITPGLYQRLVGAEVPLRHACEELRFLHGRSAAHTTMLADADIDSFEKAFTDTRAIEIHDARLYVLASRAVMELDRLLRIQADSEQAGAGAKYEVQPEHQRLDEILDTLKHLGHFQDGARAALVRKQASWLRISTAQTERVSQLLHDDRIAVSELMKQARRVFGGADESEQVQVIQVDTRSGSPIVRAALVAPES